jgi:hypothetical protein
VEADDDRHLSCQPESADVEEGSDDDLADLGAVLLLQTQHHLTTRSLVVSKPAANADERESAIPGNALMGGTSEAFAATSTGGVKMSAPVDASIAELRRLPENQFGLARLWEALGLPESFVAATLHSGYWPLSMLVIMLVVSCVAWRRVRKPGSEESGSALAAIISGAQAWAWASALIGDGGSCKALSAGGSAKQESPLVAVRGGLGAPCSQPSPQCRAPTPVLSPDFVLSKTEARFMVLIDFLLQPRSGTFEIKGATVKSLMSATLVGGAGHASSEFCALQIFTESDQKEARVTVQAESGGVFKIAGEGNVPFETLRLQPDGKGHTLFCEGTQAICFEAHGPDMLEMAVSTASGQALANSAPVNSSMWRLTVKPGVDSILITACTLSLILWRAAQVRRDAAFVGTA